MPMKKYLSLLPLAILAINPITTTAEEEEQFHIKPLQVAPDVNSVDLLTGRYYPSIPSLSIPAAPRLSLTTLQKFDSKVIGTLWASGNPLEGGQVEHKETFSLTYGGITSEYFTCMSYDCEPQDNTGSAFAGNMNTQNFTYTQGNSGLKVRYTSRSSLFDYSPPVANKSQEGTWYATEITYADGEALHITYDKTLYNQITYHRPTTVTSSVGYELRIEYVSNDITTGASGWSKIARGYIVETINPTTVLAQQVYSSGNITDLAGRTFVTTGFSSALGGNETAKTFTLKLPGDSINSLDVSSATRSYGGISHNNFVTKVKKNNVQYDYNYTAATGTGLDPHKQFTDVTITGPEGYYRRLDMSLTKAPNHRALIESDTDSLGNTTSYTYTFNNKLESVVYPEGNKVEFTYDSYGNITSKKHIAKPGSEQTNITITANYDTANCFGLECFRPTYTRDGKGNQTDYKFNSTTGQIEEKTSPAGQSGERIRTKYEYAGGRLVKKTICPLSKCSQNIEYVQIEEYDYWNNTQLPEIVTRTNAAGTLSETTTYTYDQAGRLTEEDGPLPGTDDKKFIRYDAAGRKTWEIGALNDAGYRVAKRFTYRAQDEQVEIEEIGTLTEPDSDNLNVTLTKTNSYNVYGLLIKTVTDSTTETEMVSQTSYDGLRRTVCQITRMNPAKFNQLPSSACVLGEEGTYESAYGPDRIVYNEYDTESRVTLTISGYGTPDAGIDIEIGYTNNGQVAFRKDGNGNQTSYEYDGYDRLEKSTYPDGTFESFIYDANDNKKSWRKRDGKTFTYNFDNINALTSTVIPGESTINFTYDGLGRQFTVIRGASSISYTYDGLGRTKSTKTNGRTLSYLYDSAGRRSRLTHPDGFYVTYEYDAADGLVSIKENGNSSQQLVTYGYSPLGQVETVTRKNGVTSSLDYDAPGRMTKYDHLTINNASFDYNPASQLVNRVVSNADFQIQIPTVGTQAYETNELNQYTRVGGAAISYDLNGNLTNYVGWTYNYNAHNRLTSASKTGTTLTLDYDALGTLSSSTLNGIKTNFLYDGNELVAEYNSSGTLLRRYVHGIAEDDPLVWYEGPSTLDKRYLLADERSSIIAETSVTGYVSATHKYGAFGEPINSSTSRFRYTGQILIPGTELYYYKARIYHPKLGRFLQTDPIGYDDGMNMYAYVGNDPVNYADPSGETKLVVSAYKYARRVTNNGFNFKKAGKDELADIAQDIATLADGQFTMDDVFAAVDILTGFGDDLGVIYKTYKTKSGKPYIGRADNLGERAINAKDGRDRDGAEVIGFYKKGDKTGSRVAEQNSMNQHGGVNKLDNKRNEIAQPKWKSKGVTCIGSRIKKSSC